MLAAVRYLLIVLVAGFAWGAAAQESTEPPVPRAAPRGMISEETLPRAGGVLFFGGTRGAGLAAVKELVARGEKVTAVARKSSDTAALKALGVNIFTADALITDDLVRAFAAAPFRVVVSTLGGADGNWRADDEGNRNVVAAAKSAKIPRMILVSAVGVGDSAMARPWYLRFFQKERIAAKSQAEDALRKSGLDFTIVRLGWLLDKPASGKATLTEDRMAFSWIARADVGPLVAGCVKNESLSGKVLAAFDPSRVSPLTLFR